MHLRFVVPCSYLSRLTLNSFLVFYCFSFFVFILRLFILPRLVFIFSSIFLLSLFSSSSFTFNLFFLFFDLIFSSHSSVFFLYSPSFPIHFSCLYNFITFQPVYIPPSFILFPLFFFYPLSPPAFPILVSLSSLKGLP